MIKSKFKIGFIVWFGFMIICTFGILRIIYIVIEKITEEGMDVFSFIFLIFLSLISTVLLIIFKDFKYILINKEKRTLKWFSPFNPLGKIVELKNYVGLIKSTEFGSAGDYKTTHLVDNSSMTSVKINGLFYTNFDEIFNSLELKEIKNYNFGLWKYLMLVFTGRIKIEK